MKRIFPIAVLLGVLATVICLKLYAGSFIAFGSTVTVNNTSSNGVSGSVGTLTLPGGYYLLTHGGLNNTNDVLLAMQFSTDNTNFVTIATAGAAATNAGTDRIFVPSSGALTVYFRPVITTTNSQQVGVNFIQ